MSARRLSGAFGMALVTLILIISPARAAGEVATNVAIRPIEPVVIGSVVHAVVELRRADGTLIADEPVALSLDGAHVRRSRTRADGTASIRLPLDIAPGRHELVATYTGRRDQFLGSSGRTVLEVRPYQMEIETVPPLPGMVFSVEGERFSAGDDGIARLPVNRAGDYRLAVHVDEYSNPGHRVEFSRWNTELFGPEITIRIPYGKELQSGFDVYHRASQTFIDIEGKPIDASRVRTITLRNSLGVVYENPDGGERWYKSSRTVRRPNGLESVDVRYNVDSVVVDGSNVVNSGQQRFYLTGEAQWTIELLLFSARMKTSDALFGIPAGTEVDVTFPDGHVERVEPSADGTLEVRGLARGEYRMKVADAPGWAPAVPVALSRDQEVVLRVVTHVDMGVAFLVAGGLAFGLLHIGRPHLIPGTMAGITRGIRTVATAPSRLASRAVHAPRRGIWQARPMTGTRSAVPPRISLGQVVAATIARPAPAYSADQAPAFLSAAESPVPMQRPKAMPPPQADVPRAPDRPIPVSAAAPLVALPVVAAVASPAPPAASPSLPVVGERAPVAAAAPAARARRSTGSRARRTAGTDRLTPASAGKPATKASAEMPSKQVRARKPGPNAKRAAASVVADADPGTIAPKSRKAAARTAKRPAGSTKASTANKPKASPAKKPKASTANKPKASTAKETGGKIAPTRAKATKDRATEKSPGRAGRRRRADPAVDGGAPMKGVAADSPSRAKADAGPSKAARGRGNAQRRLSSRKGDTPSARTAGTSQKGAKPNGAATRRQAGRSSRPDATDRVDRKWPASGQAKGGASERDETDGSRASHRQAQLATLGIADPGRGPVRDIAPPPASPLTRVRPPSTWRRPIVMAAGMTGCVQCGMPLGSGAAFCRRCGWLQLPSATTRDSNGLGSMKGAVTKLANGWGFRRHSGRGRGR